LEERAEKAKRQEAARREEEEKDRLLRRASRIIEEANREPKKVRVVSKKVSGFAEEKPEPPVKEVVVKETPSENTLSDTNINNKRIDLFASIDRHRKKIL
jgi:hypothetical protein